ncbi:MAG: hypothetical protein ABIH39_08230 [Candidatus Margulisiibacteriota bacterium]
MNQKDIKPVNSSDILSRINDLASESLLDIQQLRFDQAGQTIEVAFNGNYLSVLEFMDNVDKLPVKADRVRIAANLENPHEVKVSLTLLLK